MKPLERFILWGLFIAVVGTGLAGYVVYRDHVKPILEMKQRVERIEEIINKLPIKPFREGEGEVGGDCETGGDPTGAMPEWQQKLRETVDSDYAKA